MRTPMWTGEMSLKSIQTLLYGYCLALEDYKIAPKIPYSDEPFFEWIRERLGYSSSTAGWLNMIVAYSIGFKPEKINWENFLATSITFEQHCASIKLFYELVEEFKSEMDKK